MSEKSVEILKLTSVPLTREKQFIIQEEFETYFSAVNFVIKIIMRNHLSNLTKTIDFVQDAMAEKYDSRAQYIRDVVKTARVEIGRHRRLSRTIRSMRSKTPSFKPGKMILSHPIVSVDEDALVLQTKNVNSLPIPFDKHSRNQSANILKHLTRDHKIYGRIRLIWDDLGRFVKIAIRFDQARITRPPIS
jgi:hypothetical protein